MKTGGGRLASSRSPHLQQHAADPVDWYPWGPEAFAAARERDVPVLLTVGYAACHWGHVMARESYRDPAVAAALAQGFVAVAVDRDERPDVDAAALAAQTALTGASGWPATVFLTPEGDPFHAGTYYPARASSSSGVTSFPEVLAAVDAAWRGRRVEVVRAAAGVTAALAARRPPVAGAAGRDDLEAAVVALAAAEDVEHGGLGDAPRFPPGMVCEFLLRHAGADGATGSTAHGLAGRTLDTVARSAMVDQLAGGVTRCVVDTRWSVPHFEKLLPDSALLARTWLHWWQQTGEPTGRRAALEACDWVVAALTTEQGGFAAGLDADTEGVEGATYRWTRAQLVAALDDGDDAAWAADLLGFGSTADVDADADAGPGQALRLLRDPAAEPGGAARWQRVRARLLAVRDTRPQPVRFDAVVTAGNGLAVAALAEVGAACRRPDLVEAAARCADLLLRVHRDEAGHLLRVSRDGVADGAPALLDDHALLADGLLALHVATGEPRWREAAGELLEALLTRFTAGPPGSVVGRQRGGPALYDTAHDALDPLVARWGRPAQAADGATPAGASAAAGVLLAWAELTGSGRHRAAAEAALAGTGALARWAPLSAGWGLAVAQAALSR